MYSVNSKNEATVSFYVHIDKMTQVVLLGESRSVNFLAKVNFIRGQ